MRKNLLSAALLLLVGNVSIFGQQSNASCPANTKEVNQKTTVDVGFAKYERETHECKEKPEPKEKAEPKEKEPKEKPEPRERPDRP